MDCDKLTERSRYDARARTQGLCTDSYISSSSFGSNAIRRGLRAPYLCYEKAICDLVKEDHNVLELAAGIGMHTEALLRTGASVTATDISFTSLRLLKRILCQDAERLTVRCADMEALPFPSQHFDVVACAGGLSYGDNQKTLAEICRVLKHGGYFLAVDSLNHNPIYKFNRFLHYLRGNRTRGTLIRMPTLTLLDNYRRTIGTSEVRFFGTLSWLLMPISRFIGEDRAAVWSDRVDEILSVKRSAFKFVLISRKIAIDAS